MGSLVGTTEFCILRSFQTPLETAQPLLLRLPGDRSVWLKRPGCEANISPQCNAEVRMTAAAVCFPSVPSWLPKGRIYFHYTNSEPLKNVSAAELNFFVFTLFHKNRTYVSLRCLHEQLNKTETQHLIFLWQT